MLCNVLSNRPKAICLYRFLKHADSINVFIETTDIGAFFFFSV